MTEPCRLCGADPGTPQSCQPHAHRQRVRFGDEFNYLTLDPATGQPAPSCPVCRAPRGGFHHADCRVEECPVCQGSAWRCGCATAARLEGRLTA